MVCVCVLQRKTKEIRRRKKQQQRQRRLRRLRRRPTTEWSGCKCTHAFSEYIYSICTLADCCYCFVCACDVVRTILCQPSDELGQKEMRVSVRVVRIVIIIFFFCFVVFSTQKLLFSDSCCPWRRHLPISKHRTWTIIIIRGTTRSYRHSHSRTRSQVVAVCCCRSHRFHNSIAIGKNTRKKRFFRRRF